MARMLEVVDVLAQDVGVVGNFLRLARHNQLLRLLHGVENRPCKIVSF
jgi:hypothetical protein